MARDRANKAEAEIESLLDEIKFLDRKYANAQKDKEACDVEYRRLDAECGRYCNVLKRLKAGKFESGEHAQEIASDALKNDCDTCVGLEPCPIDGEVDEECPFKTNQEGS